MEWTREHKLAALMRLPWSVKIEQNAEEGYLVARVVELPSVIATGQTDRQLARDLWQSLEASLSAYLEFDDEIPLPKAAQLPWEDPKRVRASFVRIRLRGDAWDAAASTAAARSISV